jgi:hypothetical protein
MFPPGTICERVKSSLACANNTIAASVVPVAVLLSKSGIVSLEGSLLIVQLLYMSRPVGFAL